MTIEDAKFLKIDAYPRYWEDAKVNGVECDENEKSIPCRKGDSLIMEIDLETGKVENWPDNVTADFHFKVCDAGNYFLLDEFKNEIACIENDYVPSGVSHGDSDYGDYIIMKIDGNGNIQNYEFSIDEDEWDKE